LKLVDEQVLDPAIEREQQLGWLVDASERAPRREAELYEVDVAGLREFNLELQREMQQHNAQSAELAPLRVRVARLGQLLRALDRFAQRLVVAESFQQTLGACLLVTLGSEALRS